MYSITFVRENKIIGTYHSLIKTDLDIPPFIQALTSIEDKMLNQAPYFHEIAEDIYKQLEGRYFILQDLKDFLMKFKSKATLCATNIQPSNCL